MISVRLKEKICQAQYTIPEIYLKKNIVHMSKMSKPDRCVFATE